MSNVIRFVHPRRSREEARRQAGAWLARIDAGLSAEEHEQFGAWLREDSLHPQVLMEMASLWDELSILSGLSDMFPLEQYGPPGRKKLRRRLLFGAAAAGVAALALPATPVFLEALRGPGEMGTRRRYETAVGEQSTVNLPDNSVIVINTDSLVEVRYGQDERQVQLLRGEALFTVAKDVERPFRVYAGERVVEAVGTAFSVQRTADDRLEVMVTEGKVNFRTNAAPATPARTRGVAGPALSLEAGEYLRSPAPQAGVPPEKGAMAPEEMEVRLAWSQGMLMFQGERLEQVLNEIHRYTTVRLVADAETLDLPVTALLPTGNIDLLLSQLDKNLQIDNERVNENLIRLIPRR